MNLATNARDAMPNGGVLEITTQEMLVRPDGNRDLPPGRYAEIVVRDTGCGIDQSTLSRIFEPFFTTKHSGRGTGLGLSNIQAIAQRMGGRVFIASTVGVGTTVTILLPIVPETSEIPMPREYGRESTILVVEDDPNVRTTVAHYIEDLGYRSLVAANAMEAKRIAHERGDRIDVLLTDVMLPQQLGTDLAREIRDELPNVQVAFMSAHEREELVDRNRIDPETPLLQKPFDQRALARILHRLLDA